MTCDLGIQAEHLENLIQYIRNCLPGVSIWAYGSRVKGTWSKYSDLDLVVFCERNQSVSELVEILDESSLPFRVDLHCWNELPKAFQNEIEATKIVII